MHDFPHVDDGVSLSSSLERFKLDALNSLVVPSARLSGF